jgi:hydrogenase-4 component F
MAAGLVLFPLLMGVAAFAVPSNQKRPWILPAVGLIHLFLTLKVLGAPELSTISPWLVLDPAGKLVLLLVSVLFLICSFYTVGYLRYRAERSNRVFCACLLASLGTMSLVTCSHHLGLMWVAIEASALTTAPLIYFNRTPRSIEATWKYMLVGSVGIALALLGSFFLAYSSLHSGLESSLLLEDLLSNAPKLSKPWLHASFVLMLVGYGTKMGLSPMHTWKPDAYGEAPGVVGALLSGGVTSCAFLTILRINSICAAAGESAYTSTLLVFMGLLAMATAGVFMVGQRDIKRMLAYSSVEHMGILVLGIGIGAPALYGTLLHLLNNGFTKGVLFLSAGNIHRAFNSTTTEKTSGALSRLPVSGALFTAGFLAITGSPPFGPFISEFAILNGALGAGHFLAAGLYLVLLLVVFIGMGATVLSVVQGPSHTEEETSSYRDGWLTCLPPLLLMGLVLLLGLSIPAPLNTLLTSAVQYLEGKP